MGEATSGLSVANVVSSDGVAGTSLVGFRGRIDIMQIQILDE